MDRVPENERYLVTFKGKNITHNGKKLVWCPNHKSKDGTIEGRYFEPPHDHAEWEEKRRKRQERWNARKKRGAGGDGDSKPEPSTSSSKQTKPKKMKLALNNKLAQALVCKHNFSQEEADELFAESYKEAEESLN